MTEPTALILLSTAASIAFVHTVIGVDHSLPFVVLGRAQAWSLKKLWAVVALCGLGHVLSSVFLGAFGIALGAAVSKLEWIEGVRGEVAAWALIAFGITYAAWAGIKQLRGKTHAHPHVHADGTTHAHAHNHEGEHLHPHEARRLVTVWSLFIIFGLGPCEPLIPLLMVPALDHSVSLLIAVTLVFSTVTIGTMLLVTTLGYLGLRSAPLSMLSRHADVLAGVAIATSGVLIQTLGI